MSSSRHFHTHDHHHQFVLSSTKNILSELRTLFAFCIICTLRQLCSTDLEQLRNTERWPLSSGYVSSCSFALQGLDLSCLPVVLSNSYGPVTASSGASTFVLSVSPQRAMSFAAYVMLCNFSVSQTRLSSLFLYGKSCTHPRRNLFRTT